MDAGLPTDGANLLERFEAHLPTTKTALLEAWAEIAPEIKLYAPDRYQSIQQALGQDLPLNVLVMYVFRESLRAIAEAKTKP